MEHGGSAWGFQDHTFVKNYEKWIDWYWKKETTQEQWQLLSNEVAEQIKKKKYSRRQIRFWEQSHNFQATTWIMGDYVAMIVTNQKPHYLVEIHDSILAHDMPKYLKESETRK